MTGLVILAATVLLYVLVSSVLDRASITGPLFLMVAGAILGTGGLDVLNLNVGNESIRVLAEVALAIILFSDASSISKRTVRSQVGVTGRLLGIGLPLTIGLGTLICHLIFPSASWALCALIGSLLAPTDAALGLAVVTNPAVPEGIRETLSIEGGLNDGLATPFVYFFLALTLSESTHGHWVSAGFDLLGGVGLGAVLGAALGWICALCARRLTMSEQSKQLAVVVAGLLCFSAALALDWNGFVAAYVAGFAFTIGSKGALRSSMQLSESAGLYTSFAVWVLFGATLVGPILAGGIMWTAVLYGLLSLTVIRMVPVALALVGAHVRPLTTAFMGWFGPRGLASVVFVIVSVDSLSESADPRILVQAATWTILGSVVLHGLTSRPLAEAFGRAVGDTTDAPDVPRGAFQKRPPSKGLGSAPEPAQEG